LEGTLTERLETQPGLSVVRSSFMPRSDVKDVHANPPERGTLVLTFGLEGNSAYRSAQGDHLNFQSGFTTAAAFMGSTGERHFAGGQRVVQLRLLVQEQVMARFMKASECAELMPRRGVRPLASARTSAASSVHALALYRNPGASGLAALDCQIHALSLLAEQLRALGLVAVESAVQGRARDRERLTQARDLMRAQMDRPLTLAYLADAVGMSGTRFKAGFRDTFGVSPGRMLLEMRMERARNLLETGCLVAQVAWQVGYAHPSNFSAAFSRYFGYSPGTRLAVRNDRH
jgi:AraC-like DNA-binding protein